MRTTLRTINESILRNLNSLTTSMNDLDNQISSGKQMSKISDNPINLMGALGLRTDLGQIQQYQKNLLYGNNFIGASENALTGIKDLVMQAKVLATQAANSSMTPANRANMAEQVRNLFEQALTLSNTQVDGKYIFGGQRTTGYNTAEPTPFISGEMDLRRVTGNAPATINADLHGTVAGDGSGADDLTPGDLLLNGKDVVDLYSRKSYVITGGTNIADGQLLINGDNMGAISLPAATVNGLHMTGAANLKAAIDTHSSTVTANLTTLYEGGAAKAGGSSSTISFNLNGVAVSAATNGSSPGQVAQDVANAVNAVSSQTGVKAVLGDGTNGGAAGTLVLRNTLPGDETAITISNLIEPLGNKTGFTEGTYGVSSGNTGEITLLSKNNIAVSTNPASDATLALIGMSPDVPGTGAATIPFTVALPAATNGLDMQSAYNLRQALNNATVQAQTGVTAHLTTLYAGGAATADTADGNDSSISFNLNNVAIAVDIPDGSTAAQVVSSVVDGINNASEYTGVTAVVGDGTNGGPAGQIVLHNTRPGDESAIVIANLNEPDTAKSGLIPGSYAPDAAFYAGEAVTAGLPADIGNQISFTVNGVPVSYTIAAGDTDPVTGQATLASNLAAAINAVNGQTGITATVGNGTNNGGALNSLVLENTVPGVGSDIVISPITATDSLGNPIAYNPTGLTAGTYPPENTGELSYTSGKAITFSSSNYTDDTILNRLGLGGGGIGFSDAAGDGTLVYGSQLGDNELKINGIPIGSTSADGLSDVYADASAAAKAAAINAQTAKTDVTAVINPLEHYASGPVEQGIFSAGDLAINGVDIFGPGSGNLSTAYSDLAASSPVADSHFSFSLNGYSIGLDVAAGSSAAQAAQSAVDAINGVSKSTGVEAYVGNGTNGGPLNSVVFRNSQFGNENNIAVTGYSFTGNNVLGFGNFDTSTYSDSVASASAGTATFDLNGVSVSVTTAGGSSAQVAQDAVNAINAVSNQTGVKAAVGNGTNGPLDAVVFSSPQSGDERAIVVSHFSGPDILGFRNFGTAVGITTDQDKDNSLVKAINNLSDRTGVAATRNAMGELLLTTEDGRNLHIETSARGEKLSHLNGGSPAIPQSKVYFGSVQLTSDKEFLLETQAGSFETGLAALGLNGGGFETDDVAGDGKLQVSSLIKQDDSVRYAGDRENGIDIKVGAQSTLAISKNGKDALLDTGVFSELKNFESYLSGENYHQVTSSSQATDVNALLDSGDTGLASADQLTQGSFAITVTDNQASPAKNFAISIPVDPAEDSVADIAAKINGMPGISGTLDADGHLVIKATDPNRYTFTLGADTSNFLEVMGLQPEDMQVDAIGQSLGKFDTIMDQLTSQISDFGARSNRIDAQNQILSNLQLATQENLSENQDTDLTQAVMDLQSKQVAYQAALSAAAKTMQLSLVDFLK
ncbi:MAG: flagellin [Desulfobacteraceae bacterium]|nr:flagellin [Desulfobacteraceae bacterium]